MCFSTEASFIGGVVVAAIGVATIRKVHKPSQIVFASIPLFFGLQQIAEGFVWLSLQNPEYAGLLKFSTYSFLIMAEVFWPFMVPLAVLLMEKNKKRIKILRGLLGIGIAVSLYFIYCLISFDVTPVISGYHIEYLEGYPKSLQIVAFSLYLITSITPLFVSTIKRTYLLGILMAFSCLVTIIFFTQFLTSVWCFFGALISIVILWILRDARRKYILGR
ncbi:DUF6629 family protein [Flavobacterium sp. UBA6031]|uniref:DUF6629 family protein n=1 Tax=Flavobacterium sp. UBA6031 TaxID=1946551 RepID=UPI0025C3822F|nr:DUF6629 family protein [Flavobacterium sp. UBA6031]